VACLLGLAVARNSSSPLDPTLASVTMTLALLVHAAVNVLNDYYDALNGTDAANTQRLFPFTGGSRFIQNGVLTQAQTARFGYALLGLAILGGLWLMAQAGSGLIVIGALGLFIGWAYSAAPLQLSGRGLGELCVLLGFTGVVLGTDFVQRQTFSLQALIAGIPYALLVTNLLYINQFPDRAADASACKRHWVVRLRTKQAALGYPLLAGVALFWLLAATALGALPTAALLSALPLLFSARAAVILCHHAETPKHLRPAIQLSLAAMLTHGLLLTGILWLETAA
jgi:1,4-dihydroxy-2-naphthoate octaprenyltransferase